MSRLARRLPHLDLSYLGRWPRRLLAGCCLLLALLSAVSKPSPPASSAETTPVVVAARSMPAGHLLARRDVSVARWPPAVRPPGAPSAPSAVVGRRLAGPVGTGEPIAGTRLVGADLATALPAGLVAAAVSLADPHAADLVRAGDRVDLLATAKPIDPLAGPGPLAAHVRVLATSCAVLAVLPQTATADAELVLAVDRATALRITRDSVSQLFTAVVARP
ncbi:MAG: pilus assembly protein CpaB [Pseudonocardiales bacterium]|nr:pilus assembly protein CpaB [Pseudonocardiales bacterium]